MHDKIGSGDETGHLQAFLLNLPSCAHQELNSQGESLTTKLQPTFEILNHAKSVITILYGSISK